MNTFRYILSLLCAMLALSQTSLAQDTKAVPSDPVFPYLLRQRLHHRNIR